MKTILNIGLNNNPYDVADITYVLNTLFDGKPTNFDILNGEYNGEVEPTLAVEYDGALFNHELESLCELLTQECIAVKVDGKGKMIFNPNFTGDKFEFSDEHFLIPVLQEKANQTGNGCLNPNTNNNGTIQG